MHDGPLRPTTEQRKFAKRLRLDQTNCERLLWQCLRDRQLGEYPLPPYVLDFYCAGLGLAVELDGGQHFSDEALRGDAERSRYLEGYGVRVLRFSNREVLRRYPRCWRRYCSRPRSLPSPQPSALTLYRNHCFDGTGS